MKTMSTENELQQNSPEEQRKKANEFKEKGNGFIKVKDYESASKICCI